MRRRCPECGDPQHILNEIDEEEAKKPRPQVLESNDEIPVKQAGEKQVN